MTRAISLFALAFFLIAGLAAAGQGPTAKKPRPLNDRALDTITAGSASVSNSGGAIVANSSDATISEKGAINVSGNAQQDSRALNMVNSIDSAVANAVNVWDGKLDTAPAAAGAAAVTPQAQPPNGIELNVTQGNNVSQDMTRSASLPLYIRKEANIDETEKTTREITGEGHVDTVSEVLGQSIQGGQGFAGAASADLALTGGSIALSNNIKISAEGHADLGIGFGLFDGDAGTSTTVETTQTLTWTLPALDLHVDGVVCAVSMGSCDASGSFKSSSEVTRSVRGPVKVEDASAEYIVVDGSTLDVTVDNAVTLSGFAQNGARALNLVNAAGSAVTNAVNVARTPTVGPVLNLSQANYVRQGR